MEFVSGSTTQKVSGNCPFLLTAFIGSWLQSSAPRSSGQRNSSELGSGLLSRWLSSHYHGGVHDEKSVAHHTVNLLTATIKVDADQSDLRFCFRIISPTKNYTLQVHKCLIFCLMLVFYIMVSKNWCWI